MAGCQFHVFKKTNYPEPCGKPIFKEGMCKEHFGIKCSVTGCDKTAIHPCKEPMDTGDHCLYIPCGQPLCQDHHDCGDSHGFK